MFRPVASVGIVIWGFIRLSKTKSLWLPVVQGDRTPIGMDLDGFHQIKLMITVSPVFKSVTVSDPYLVVDRERASRKGQGIERGAPQ